MFKYKENNELFSIDNYLSKKLLEKFDVTDPSPASLTETAGYLLSEKNVELNDNIEFLDGSIIEYLDTSIKKSGACSIPSTSLSESPSGGASPIGRGRRDENSDLRIFWANWPRTLPNPFPSIQEVAAVALRLPRPRRAGAANTLRRARPFVAPLYATSSTSLPAQWIRFERNPRNWTTQCFYGFTPKIPRSEISSTGN